MPAWSVQPIAVEEKYMPSDPTIVQFLVVSFIIGLACGLIPFLVGRNFGMPRHARGGLILCIAGGLIGGIFIALPIALIFTGFIIYYGR